MVDDRDVDDWLREQFGTVDKSLLRTDSYSNKELRKDKANLEHQREKLNLELKKHQKKYQELIEKGSEATGNKKQALAKKAKLERKRFNLRRTELNKLESVLAAILLIEAGRELMEDESATGTIDQIVDEVSPTTFQSRLEERMAEFDVDAETMDTVQESLGIDIQPDVDDTQNHLMESMASYEMDVDMMESIQDELNIESGPTGPSASPDTPSIGEISDFGDFGGSEDETGIKPGHNPENTSDKSQREISINVRQLTDALTETVLRLHDHYVVSSMFREHYAVTWEAPFEIQAFLDAVPAMDKSKSVEVSFEANGDYEPERLTSTLPAVRMDERFPEACRFLALTYDRYELTWEREGTHTDGRELTATVETYDDHPFWGVFRQSLEDELHANELGALLGRLTESLETDAPRDANAGGDN